MNAQGGFGDEARTFLAGLSQVHLVAIKPDSPAIEGYDFGKDVERALIWASARSGQGHNIYWTVNQVRSGVHKKN